MYPQVKKQKRVREMLRRQKESICSQLSLFLHCRGVRTHRYTHRDTDTRANALQVLQVLMQGFPGHPALFAASVPLHMLYPLWDSSPLPPLGISPGDPH